MKKPLLDICKDEIKSCGIAEAPLLTERLCSSIGCHVLNLSNLENKRFYYAGSEEKFRKHIILMAPSGFGKTVFMNLFLDSQNGLLSRVEGIPTSIRSTFSPESWLGTIYQATDEEGNKVTKSNGIFDRFKTGIIGADEFMRLKHLAENEVTNNEEVYLLSALESSKATKDLALGSIEETDIGTTMWCGMRFAHMDTTSGLLRRFTFHLFYPTPTIARQFKRACRGKTDGNGKISLKAQHEVKDEVNRMKEIIDETRSIDYKYVNRFLSRELDCPHFEEEIYRRIAAGYSVAKGTFPNIQLTDELKTLLKNESWSREVVRDDPKAEAIDYVVRQEGGMDVNELKRFFVRYYMFNRGTYDSLLQSLYSREKLYYDKATQEVKPRKIDV